MRECKNTVNFGDQASRMILAFDRDVCLGHFNVGAGQATILGGLSGDKLYYSLSFCSPSDNFCKRVGSEMALQRLTTDSYSDCRFVMPLSKDKCDTTQLKPEFVLMHVLNQHVQTGKSCPHWARHQAVRFRKIRELDQWGDCPAISQT